MVFQRRRVMLPLDPTFFKSYVTGHRMVFKDMEMILSNITEGFATQKTKNKPLHIM